jgi:hypothetical protein
MRAQQQGTTPEPEAEAEPEAEPEAELAVPEVEEEFIAVAED